MLDGSRAGGKLCYLVGENEKKKRVGADDHKGLYFYLGSPWKKQGRQRQIS